MERIPIADAERDLPGLVHRICTEGIGFELALGTTIVARLLPACPTSPVTVNDLNTVLASLPSLGDESGSFSAEIQAIRREFPTENTLWD